MQLAAAKRRFEMLHKDKPYHDGLERYWTEEPTEVTPFHFADGVSIYLSEIDEHPDDDFLQQGTGDALPAEQPGGEQDQPAE